MRKTFLGTLLVVTLSLGSSSYCSSSNNTEFPLQEHKKMIQDLSDEQKQKLVQEVLDTDLALDTTIKNIILYAEPMFTIYILSLMAATLICTLPCLTPFKSLIFSENPAQKEPKKMTTSKLEIWN